MRLSLTLLMVLVLVPAATLRADDKTTRERKIRVALALAAPTCGKCREDVIEARAEAAKLSKPIALFVGGPCDGAGCVAELAGAIPVKAPTYTDDGRPAAEKRIVILTPKAAGDGFLIDATLPPKTSPEQLTAAVQKATPPPKSLPKSERVIDWFVK